MIAKMMSSEWRVKEEKLFSGKIGVQAINSETKKCEFYKKVIEYDWLQREKKMKINWNCTEKNWCFPF